MLDDERERVEKERREQEKRRTRKLKRRGSNASLHGVMAVHCHSCVHGAGLTTNSPSTPRMAFPTIPVVGLNLTRDDVVKAYSASQRSQVTAEEQKKHYDMAQELTSICWRPTRKECTYSMSDLAYREVLRGVMFVMLCRF